MLLLQSYWQFFPRTWCAIFYSVHPLFHNVFLNTTKPDRSDSNNGSAVHLETPPHRKCWMMGVTHSHLLCNCSCSFSIFQAVYAEEHAHSMSSFSSCNINRKYFWISGGQPGRLCSSWSSKAYMNTVFPNFINDSVQPFENYKHPRLAQALPMKKLEELIN